MSIRGKVGFTFTEMGLGLTLQFRGSPKAEMGSKNYEVTYFVWWTTMI